MLNMSVARTNMQKQQLKTWGIHSTKILDLFGNIPREHFLPESLHNMAYADTQLPIGHSQVTMPPKELARALQSLQISKDENILEIGTGTSYGTALLAELGHHVHSVDIFEEFTFHAKSQLHLLGIDNIQLDTGDASKGWCIQKQFDVIFISASLPTLPEIYRQQLTIGGRLFVILGENTLMHACLITRTSEQDWSTERLFETVLPGLINAPHKDKFVF